MLGGNAMRTLFAVVSLLPALLFSQGPEFAEQYRQRLGGAIDELTAVVEHFQEDAQRSGYDRDTALRLMAQNTERLVRDLGTRMQENVARLDLLRRQQRLFSRGVTLGSLTDFAFNHDAPLFEKTWESYAPGLSLSFLGLLLAIVGWSASCVLLLVVAWSAGSYARASA
jgi:Protein of unknown function (DUF2937)